MENVFSFTEGKVRIHWVRRYDLDKEIKKKIMEYKKEALYIVIEGLRRKISYTEET